MTDPQPKPVAGTALERAALEIEQHTSASGWDQRARVFALVPTHELLARESGLADALSGSQPDDLTPVEQDELPDHASLEELLHQIGWPPEVAGTAVAVERLMVPSDAEAAMPEAHAEALSFLATHPGRQEIRLVVAVMRDGQRACALRFRSHDSDDAVLTGNDLAPGLADALAATLVD